jgi:hypothetical protein
MMVNESLRSKKKTGRSKGKSEVLESAPAGRVLALHQFENRAGEFPRRLLRRVVADPRQDAALIGSGKERRMLF